MSGYSDSPTEEMYEKRTLNNKTRLLFLFGDTVICANSFFIVHFYELMHHVCFKPKFELKNKSFGYKISSVKVKIKMLW